ncbi:microcin C transport system substrate-binding protein [Parvibaculum indicum]|uniref:extracellular solute-binding protein n=1 Tax=Parvibaculum indicum TaxID=562969 RepID=UPI0031B56CFF|nr:microcin C transport system substrate-binding protein [Parvibaculum indicum]
MRYATAMLAALTIGAFLTAPFHPAQADDTPRHGSSLFGELKYGPDFAHFNYVNPDAPKGGEVAMGTTGGFDSLNTFVVKGNPAAGLSLIYDTLMAPSYDEPSAEYGLVAKTVSHPDDFSSVTYTLRKEARFHDGTPITPEDVIWSFNELKKINPFYNAYYRNVETAEKLPGGKVKFSFSEKGNRELPQIVGQLPVLPRHYWTGKNADGQARDITKTTLETPLGSGPYKIAKVETPRRIIYERVEDYWAKDLPVNVGQNNFERIRFEYFKDPTVALEAFKTGRVDFRIESSAKNWATAYAFPAAKDGRVKLEKIDTDNNQGMQGFAFNLRRGKFSDPRVREAFDYAFDFEWANKALFYGQYTRTNSYFANSELASSGIPKGKELALLEPFRDKLPKALFTEPYKTPKTDGSGNNRANLRTANDLLNAAGWTIEGGKRINQKTGEQMSVEFLLSSPTFERIVLPYQQSLERLGIDATIRTVDTSQYENRVDNFDFDIIVQSFPQSMSPGNEQRDFWSCQAAETPGSRNVIGICDPVVEALIDKIIYAKSRTDLVVATHALDRVLLWRHYVVPQWYAGYFRVAYWSRIAHPGTMPGYAIGFPNIWWHSADANRKAGDGAQ